MAVTIKQIAEHTGLSIPTVGNILGRSASRYSAETRRRVAAAARQLGYKPNSSARAMRQGRFGCAALVLGRSRQQSHSYIPPRLLDGLDDQLAGNDMHLTVSRLSDEELSDPEFAPKVLREHMADGMIINYTHDIPPRMMDLIDAHHAPAVWINVKHSHDCVYPDDFGAARNATEHLLRLGHRRIAMVHLIAPMGENVTFALGWRRQHFSAADRAEGYARAMSAAGLATRVLSHERFLQGGDAFEACRALLQRPDRPTAALAYSEGEAQTFVMAARSLGLAIPRDLSLIVFSPVNQWFGDCWATVAAIPSEQVGRRAVDMLMRKLRSAAAAPEEALDCAPEAVGYAVSDGGSVAPPAPAASPLPAVAALPITV